MCEEERLPVGGQQALQALARISSARCAAGGAPQGQHGLDVLREGTSDLPVEHRRTNTRAAGGAPDDSRCGHGRG